MKKKKGFTLIELLATILVLAVIVSISIYVGIQVVKKAKQKTYEVTVSEVESYAKDYVLENSDKLNYKKENPTDLIEYQCIKVQNLIDFGYLSNDVVKSSIADGRNVNKNDYIYVERETNSKTITKSIYLDGKNNTTQYFSKCGV